MPTDRGRTLPIHRPRIAATTALLLVGSALSLGLSACSNTTSSSTETTGTVPIAETACRLITPTQVHRDLGTSVASPIATVHGSVTSCSYRSSDLGKSVILSFDSESSASKFAKNRALLRRQGDKLGKILGLGDEAYYALSTTKGVTVTTVVGRRGSQQVVAISTTGTLSDLEVVAEEALAAVRPSSPTTTATAPVTTTTAG
jgi:hypothetical protein